MLVPNEPKRKGDWRMKILQGKRYMRSWIAALCIAAGIVALAFGAHIALAACCPCCDKCGKETNKTDCLLCCTGGECKTGADTVACKSGCAGKP